MTDAQQLLQICLKSIGASQSTLQRNHTSQPDDNSQRNAGCNEQGRIAVLERVGSVVTRCGGGV